MLIESFKVGSDTIINGYDKETYPKIRGKKVGEEVSDEKRGEIVKGLLEAFGKRDKGEQITVDVDGDAAKEVLKKTGLAGTGKFTISK